MSGDDLFHAFIGEAPHLVTALSLSEENPPLGLQELHHVSVLLRFRHKTSIAPLVIAIQGGLLGFV